MALEQWVLENLWWLVLVAAWSLPWKGVALWRAARRNETWWFVAFLVVNTLAILEIFYIFYWTGRRDAHDPRFGRI